MNNEKEFLKQQLTQQGINPSDEDLTYLQRVLGIIDDGAEELENFPEVEDESIMLTMDLEELNND
jgi:hypothetical protein